MNLSKNQTARELFNLHSRRVDLQKTYALTLKNPDHTSGELDTLSEQIRELTLNIHKLKKR
jgi:hypothetical protein